MYSTRIIPMLLTAALLTAVPAQAAPVRSVRHSVKHHAAGAVARPLRAAPRGSFTSLRVESLAELQSQVHHDPVVRRRYARFFHMPENQVTTFVDHNLYSMRIPKTTHCVVYFVDPKGRFYTHPITLKPGSRVFALRRTGQPALNFICGNGFLIPLKIGYVPVNDVQVSASLEDTAPTERMPVYDFLGSSYGATPVVNVFSPSVITASSGRNLLPLAGLGLLGLRTGGHSPAVVVPSVPEPGAAVFLLAGLPLLGWAVRRRQRG